jgi:N-methylhydantoinase A
MSHRRLSVDVGGTFTDFVLLDDETGEVTHEKVPTFHENLEQSFFEGIARLETSVEDLATIVHGTTVVINAILQRKGAPVALITTEGFGDVVELGRGNRPYIYDVFYQPPPPIVPRNLRFEVAERLDFRGEILEDLDESRVEEIARDLRARGMDAAAICFLHAYANPVHELRAGEILTSICPGLHVSMSHQMVGEWREYERFTTTTLNAWVMPLMASYLQRLEESLKKRHFRGALGIMQSTGGVMSSDLAKSVPMRTLESGPAGGVMGAAALGELLGCSNVISADAGGTSFDVALIVDGKPFESSQTCVDRYPVLLPTIDVVSIGAGGGSIAWIHEDGSLRVGPQSAETDPGPACFGKGGEEPTVTDAHLLLGRINPEYFLGRRMMLDVRAAEKAIRLHVAEPLGLTLVDAAHGITHIADMNMTYAIRNLTIERGFDPRDFVLMCYGGAGGLFATSLAQELEIPRVIIPPEPATFSAWGILNTDYREDAVRTSVAALLEGGGREERVAWTQAAGDQISSAEDLLQRFAALEESARQALRKAVKSESNLAVTRSMDMRYEGQEHSIHVMMPDEATLRSEGLEALKSAFDNAHDRYYEHSSPETPAELVTLRASVVSVTKKPMLSRLAPGSGNGEAAVKGHRSVYFQQVGDFQDCPICERSRLGAGDHLLGPAIVEEWASTTIVGPAQRLEVGDFGELVISPA